MKNQKGISLTITFFIMTIVVMAAASIGTILYKEVKITNAVATTAVVAGVSDSGAENATYFIKKQIPSGASIGLCNTCNICAGYTPACQNCVLTGSDCGLTTCTNCRVSYTGSYSGKTYAVSSSISPAVQPIKVDSTGNYNGVVGQATRDVYVGLLWNATGPAGKNYVSAAASSDGRYLVAAVFGGRLYFSSNYGLSWAEIQPAGNVDAYWWSVAISSDGSRIIAGGSTTGAPAPLLYTSDNYGQFGSWTSRNPGGAIQPWVSVASSASGVHLVAGSMAGGLYLSANSGASWTPAPAPVSASGNWRALGISASGQYIIAGNYGGNLYLSTNYGQTFATKTITEGRTISSANWTGATVTDNGILGVTILNGRVHLATDFGASWTAQTLPSPVGSGNRDFSGLATSSDGLHLITAITSGDVYVTFDRGINWAKYQPGGISSGNWKPVAISSNGLVYLAGVYGGNLYLGFSH